MRLALLIALWCLLHEIHDNEAGIFQRETTNSPRPVALDKERTKLITDALGWMTFRKNGVLMKDPELETLFLKHLIMQYEKDLVFRSLVIAFQKGILPRLTLNENEDCDPRYAKRYKLAVNNSVPIDLQRRFTYVMYVNRNTSKYTFCDYRQGLVCNPSTSKCQCPEGSKMQAIDPSSQVKRCLLEENQVCNLIDIDHGTDPGHDALAVNLHHLIFNLEKPISCKPGAQCRFKDPNINTPLCYPVAGGPWATSKELEFGTECAVGLYATPGSCITTSTQLGVFRGYQCYNFGPRRSTPNASSKIGFCANELGPFGVAYMYTTTNKQLHYHPLFTAFVHPRSVPVRGRELEEFYRYYVNVVKYCAVPDPSVTCNDTTLIFQVEAPGGRCNVAKTAEWRTKWKYFEDLDGPPPPGQDYVKPVTGKELMTRLKIFADWTKDLGKICKVYHDYFHDSPLNNRINRPLLECVSTGEPDEENNDGKCEIPQIPSNDTMEFANKFQDFLDMIAKYTRVFRKNIIYENPEAPCSPSVSPIRPDTKGTGTTDALIDGYCPDGYFCIEDFNDKRGNYDSECNYMPRPETTYFICTGVSSSKIPCEKCEDKHLDKLITQEFENLLTYHKLERGETCEQDKEKTIREHISNYGWRGKYHLLAYLQQERANHTNATFNGYCDRTKFLLCTSLNTCECARGSKPRTVTVDGKEYLSDYCYQSSGRCADVELVERMHFTEAELRQVTIHYGERNWNCENTNMCVYVKELFCTTENTGSTGFNGEMSTGTTEEVTVRTTGKGNVAGAGWRHAGRPGLVRASILGALSCPFIFSIRISGHFSVSSL